MPGEKGSNLYLYTSVGCHLCEKAEALLDQVSGGVRDAVLLMEISESDDLMASYGLRIPVLAGTNRAGAGPDGGSAPAPAGGRARPGGDAPAGRAVPG